MNENIDLTKILKNCPKGYIFYSSIYGYVKFNEIRLDNIYPIVFSITNKDNYVTKMRVTKTGYYDNEYFGECTLFPSKEQRDWSKFNAPWIKKERFDPKTLQPFDEVLVRIDKQAHWCCEMFSFTEKGTNLINCCGEYYRHCIPYNKDTKHLVGTTDEAPEYYRYWED